MSAPTAPRSRPTSDRSASEMRRQLTHGRMRRPRRPGPAQRRQEVEALGAAQELDRQHPLDVGAHLPQVHGGDRAHRDVILLAGRGRDRVDAGGVRQHLVLAHQAGGDVLGDHEAGVESAVAGQKRRLARLTWSGSASARCAAREIDPSSASAILSMSSAKATGSPWKLPFDITSPLRRPAPAGCRWRR